MQEMKQKIIQYITGNIKEIITIKRLESINNKAKRIRHNSLTGFSKKKYSFNCFEQSHNKNKIKRSKSSKHFESEDNEGEIYMDDRIESFKRSEEKEQIRHLNNFIPQKNFEISYYFKIENTVLQQLLRLIDLIHNKEWLNQKIISSLFRFDSKASYEDIKKIIMTEEEDLIQKGNDSVIAHLKSNLNKKVIFINCTENFFVISTDNYIYYFDG